MTRNNTVRTVPTRAGAPARAAAPARVAQCNTVCSSCELRELCRPCCDLSRAEKAIAARLAFLRLRLRRGECLYRTDARFTSLYAVRRGFFKSVAQLENGREQVTGFGMSGEILGMDGIASERHTSDCVALEDSEVCAIPFAGLQDLALELPRLQRQFHKTMSREIAREGGVLLQLGSMNAEERLATFLLNLSRRFAAHGHSPAEFYLRMSREEIASYLGVKLETVSRTFSRFQDAGLISVRSRSIGIRNGAGLAQVMGREPARSKA